MRIVTKADSGQWLKATNTYEQIMAKAATKAMRATGKLAEQKGRQAIGAAGFTSNVQRTLRALNKPPSGYVLNPTVWLHSTVNYLDVFETGRTITGSPYLWLPLPNVPPNVGSGTKFGGLISRPHMTPRQYIAKIGPLITIKGKNGLPMLAAVIKKRSSTKGRPSRKTLGKTATQTRFFAQDKVVTETIPMFFAVSSVTIPKKFDVHAATEEAFKSLQDFYKQNLEAYEGRK